ncbi:hypothetical protein K4K53_009785 [Colletotrichum sp. SAR 10_77]|nr:hypothetical protein K4K53_009785 [Colletotrichum sp. SAR 10_77]KAJ4995805.1 hypothetical protein K4K48_009587 [Colletotrichum sp. SAR 10_66]
MAADSDAHRDPGANMYEETTVDLHNQWDAVLVVTKDNTIRKFRVCSNVLSAASPYFESLLVVPTFSEAIKVQNGQRPDIHLEENHYPDAMEVMLSILHYRMRRQWDMVTPEELATIAICADQYRCVEALKAQIGQWLVGQPKSNKADPDEIGYLLVALQRFEHPEEFSRTLVAAVMNIPFSFDFGSWATDPIISELDEDQRARIQQNIEKVKTTLTKFLYSAITDLTFNDQPGQGFPIMGSVDLEASQEFMQLCDEGIRNLTINDVESWEWDTWTKRLPSGIRQTMADKIRFDVHAIHSDITTL